MNIHRNEVVAGGLRLGLLAALVSASLFSARIAVAAEPGMVENIAADWQPDDRQRLEVSAAEASASLGGPYAPAAIHDGNRKTKWVCPLRPSPGTPQHITLQLAGGGAEVSAVAVFGERLGNDGILDAEIQVETEGTFTTVASLRKATTSSWLASFAPVRAAKVRLLVLRSSGPTDHTDVWEMEIYGKPLSDAELRAQAEANLEKIKHDADDIVRSLAVIKTDRRELPPVLRKPLEALQDGAGDLQQNLDQWAKLARSNRRATAQKARAGAVLAQRLLERSQRAGRANQPRLAALEMLIRDLRRPAGSAGFTVDFGPEQVTLANDQVAVSVNPKAARWNVLWTDGIDAAISGAGFSSVVNEKEATSHPAQTAVRKGRDPLGGYQEWVCAWETNGIRIERDLRIYEHGGAVTLGGRITNQSERDLSVGTTKLLDLGANGWWQIGEPWEAPAAVYIQGHSLLRSTPFEQAETLESAPQRSYRSSGLLELVGRDPSVALLIGYVQAGEAAPDLAAEFRLDEGGTGLIASSRFQGRRLEPGQSLELNRLYLAAQRDPFQALEVYGEAAAKFSARAVRTGPTSLWCSWYAHRLEMTENRVLANADVAAKHFQPLGLDIMQLDHGWQRGDITGDWIPNERFPHGLKWLAEQLRTRYNLRLGVWIAPTDVAETSELFRQHPDWILKGEDQKPRVNWRWYWKPNPNCYELDATHPAAFNSIVETFRRLTDEGVSYYKIDFIAAAGGEQFVPYDARATRGWTNLRRAMEAIRQGAGDQAWIRYCQTPPILSVGLAHSAYGGDDTLDAGIPDRFDVLRDNAHALAAGYWLNDRLYHREVCDMSVRRQGSVEEVRVRGALMALANCSISWSDELCYLPPSRIQLMQQCLPPGNPPMRPLDLFERDVPSLWHLKVTNTVETWDVVGVFNFNRQSESRRLRFDQLGLNPTADYAVFEFWEERFLGLLKSGIELTLPPESSRILSIRKVTGIPQLIGTDMHLLQGFHEVKRCNWDNRRAVLSGVYHRAPGLRGKAFILVPEGYAPHFDFPLSPASARLTHLDGSLWMQEIEFTQAEHSWEIPFEAPKAHGFMRTPWQKTYALLPAFGDLLQEQR